MQEKFEDSVEYLSEDEDRVTSTLVREVTSALIDEDFAYVKDLVEFLHPADLASLIGFLTPDARAIWIKNEVIPLNGEVLCQLDKGIKDDVLDSLDTEQIAEAIADVDSGDAVYLLENLSPAKIQGVLSRVSTLIRLAVEQAFQYPEGSAARIMRRDFLTVPFFWSVKQTINFCLESDALPEKFYGFYVVDPAYKPVGYISLADLLRAKRDMRLEQIAERDLHSIPLDMDQSDIAYRFEHYELSSAPVIETGGRIIGVILVDDIVEVVHEEASEGINQFAGGATEDIHDPLLRVIRSRSSWLFVNLWTAILAAIIIAAFSETIEKDVVLAAMGPLVASMGGNAGSQSLALAIRSLAVRSLNISNMYWVLKREVKIGLSNGIIFAVIIGIMVLGGGVLGLWAINWKLCVIMSAAMLIQMSIATISGLLIPFLMRALKSDPAVSAVVFVTTITDIVGFFSVLGLAHLFL